VHPGGQNDEEERQFEDLNDRRQGERERNVPMYEEVPNA
jgi:hypothetical protein